MADQRLSRLPRRGAALAAGVVVAVVAAACSGPAGGPSGAPAPGRTGPVPSSTTSSRPSPASRAPGSSSSRPSTSSTSSTAATGAPATTLPPGSEPYTWQVEQSAAALDLGGGPTSTLAAVVPAGAQREWLIAGTRTTSTGRDVATVWRSADATKWSGTTLPLPAGATWSAARAATTWGERQVVVGSAGDDDSAGAAVWISDRPGRPFTAVPESALLGAPGSAGRGSGTSASPGAAAVVPGAGTPAGEPVGTSASTSAGATGIGAGSTVMDAVAGGALGLFAAGTTGGKSTMWYSTNGVDWQDLPGANSAIDHYAGAVVNTILAAPQGVMAAGSVVDGNRLAAALWSSSDGIHWRALLGPFSSSGDGVITALVDMSPVGNPGPAAPGSTGVLALGGVRTGTAWGPASWISPNGQSWSQVSESFPVDNELPGSPGALAYAASGSDGTVYAAGGSPGRQHLWRSSNGLAWSTVALPSTVAHPSWALPPAAAFPPSVGGGDLGHLGLVAANGHTVVLADNLPGQPYVLVRQATRWWQPSAGGEFGRPLPTAVPSSLVPDRGSLVVSVDVSHPGYRLGTERSSVAVLTSPNGQDWRLANGDAFGQATANQLLPVPGGLLAVGSASLGTRNGKPVPLGSTAAFARLSTDGGATWPRPLVSPATLGGPGRGGGSAPATGAGGAPAGAPATGSG
ncbi:MAG: hypothetical protein ACRDZX_09490, partial [Acidimicrobiales bacterium]